MFRKSSQPDVLIVSQIDNLLEPSASRTSHVYDGLVMVHGAGYSNSHDQMIAGYNYKGLPFQVLVDGVDDNDECRKERIQFINQHIRTLISKYSMLLCEAGEPRPLMLDLVKEIEKLREDNAPASKFKMSVVITYQRDDELRAAGFGIGNPGVVLRTSAGEIRPLVHPNSQNNHTEAFGDLSGDLEHHVMRLNDIFDTTVFAGDEIFSYTHVKENLSESVLEAASTHQKKNKIRDINVAEHHSLFKEIEKQNKDCRDDYLLGSVFIPNEARQNEITEIIFDNCKEALNDNLYQVDSVSEEEAQPASEFERDAIIKALLDAGASEDQLAIFAEVLKDEQQNKISIRDAIAALAEAGLMKYQDVLYRKPNHAERNDESQIKEQGEDVFNAIIALKKAGAPLSKLIMYMTKTLSVLENPHDQQKKDDLAAEGKKLLEKHKNPKRVHGILWKTLGVAMMMLGGLAAGFGLITIAGGIPASILPAGWAAIGIGSGICAAGLMLFDQGAKAYIKGKKCHDVIHTDKVMKKLAN
jgi:hypothetical protein